jgi:hypothetical protein
VIKVLGWTVFILFVIWAVKHPDQLTTDLHNIGRAISGVTS